MPAEPDGPSIICLLLSVLLLFLAAFYGAAGSALDALSPAQLKKDADAGEKRAKKLQQALDAQTGTVFPMQYGLLITCLFGTSLWIMGLFPVLSGIFSAVPSPSARRLLSCCLAAVCYLLLFTVFGDVLPKKAVRKNPQRFAMRHAGSILLLSRLTRPCLILFEHISNAILRLFRIDPKTLDDAVTEEEILQIVGEGEEKGVIEETEKDMILGILDFNDTTAGETMTHRTDILAVQDDAPISEAVNVAVENGCSRIPVYHEDIDSVVGICYIKDLLPYVGREIPEFVSLKEMMRPAYFIPETKKCSQLFTEMTERKVQIAIVVDEYGGTAGLITLEDLVESIVGNIQDEYDNEEEEIQQVSETEFTVDGTTSIGEISDLTGVELPEGDYDTIAGLVTEQLGRIPKEDEQPSITISGLTITVLSVEEQRLAKLLVVKNPPAEESDEEEKSED